MLVHPRCPGIHEGAVNNSLLIIQTSMSLHMLCGFYLSLQSADAAAIRLDRLDARLEAESGENDLSLTREVK